MATTKPDRPVREEEERKAKIAAMQALVDEGLASGIGTRSTEELLKEAQSRAH